MPLRKDGLIIEKKKAIYKNKLAVIGFPGMAYIGKGVADYLINALKLDLEVIIHPIYSPANVVVERGSISPPTINIYSKRDIDVVVITSSFQPQSDEGQNYVAHMLLDYLASKKVQGIMAAAAYVTSSPSKPRRTYVASTNKDLLKKLIEIGLTPIDGGIAGLNGLIPGLSHLYGVPGAVILGETGEVYVAGNIMDPLSIASVLEVFKKVLAVEFDLSELYERGREIEERLISQLAKQIGEKEEKPSLPTHL